MGFVVHTVTLNMFVYETSGFPVSVLFNQNPKTHSVTFHKHRVTFIMDRVVEYRTQYIFDVYMNVIRFFSSHLAR